MRFAVLAVLLLGCAQARDEVPVTQPAPAENAPAPAGIAPPVERHPGLVVVLTGTFEPTSIATTALRGQVFVTEPLPDRPDDPYALHIQLENLPRGAHGWHIHHGPCSAPHAPVVLALSSTADREGIAKPLIPNEFGVVDEAVSVPAGTLTVEALRSDDYSLRIHNAAGRVVACAVL